MNIDNELQFYFIQKSKQMTCTKPLLIALIFQPLLGLANFHPESKELQEEPPQLNFIPYIMYYNAI